MNFVNKLEKNLKFGELLTETSKTSVPMSTEIPSDNILTSNISVSKLLWLIVIIVITGMIVYCWCNNKNDKFSESNKNKTTNVKNENTKTTITMLYNDNCPYSNKMKKELIGNEMRILGKIVKLAQVESTHGKNLRKQYGIIGTPAIIKETPGEKPNIIMGFTPLNEIENKFKNSNENSNENSNSNKHPGILNDYKGQILLIGNNHCGFCLKQKKFFEDKQIPFKFVDSNSEEGISYMRKYQANGVPLLVYIKDGKEEYKVGYSENFN